MIKRSQEFPKLLHNILVIANNNMKEEIGIATK